MESCDVLIVGGGPAGSSCAWGLRTSGLDVVVLDKHVFPRDKVCGGWITPQVLAKLEIDPADYARGRTLQPITAFRVGCIGDGAVETTYGEPVSYGIRRREFDDYLLKRSQARLLLGTALTSLARGNGGWIVNDRIQARVVVGAGGHFCPVARLASAKKTHEQAVVAQEIEFEMNGEQLAGCHVRRDTPELYFCPDMKGYGWCFRKGDILNVGLGRADLNRLPAHVAGFLEFLNTSGRISFEVPPLHGHAYLLHGMSTRTVIDDGLLLVGDAAGLAYEQSGEGILPAAESGLLAARIIAEVAGLYDSERLEKYRALLGSRRQPLLMGIGHFIPSQLIDFLARQLLKSRWFVRDVVLNQWFLHGSPQRDEIRRQRVGETI